MSGHDFDVCVLGSFMKDLVVQAPRRPMLGETVRGHRFQEFLGGKGVNQAVAAARLGARTAMIGRLGRDRYGDEFTQLLAAEGIDARHVSRDEHHGTGVGLPVVQPDGANSIIIIPRANDAVCPADVTAAADVIRASRVLLVQLELPVDTVMAALGLARAAGVVTVLNPAPFVDLPAEIAELVDVIVPNEIEAEQLTGLPCTDEGVSEVARRTRRTAARLGTVVTLGARGAVVVDHVDPALFDACGHDVDRADPAVCDARTADVDEDGWRLHRLPTYPVNPVDTVGAGDAFCGALAARLAAGDTLLAAADYASAAGALATTRAGGVPAMPGKDEVEFLRKEVGRQRCTHGSGQPTHQRPIQIAEA